MGVGCSIGLSYMSNYKDSLYKYAETGNIEIPLINEESGILTDNIMCNIDIVVRIYRKLQDKADNTIYTTRQILKKPLPFLIYDREEIRPAYYKDNVHAAINNIKTELNEGLVVLPKLIGAYSIDESNLANRIISDVLKAGYNEFVVKLNEKTPYTDISTLFFCAENELHKRILKDNIANMQEKILDVRYIIVEPLYGSGFIEGKKIEIRTVNIANHYGDHI